MCVFLARKEEGNESNVYEVPTCTSVVKNLVPTTQVPLTPYCRLELSLIYFKFPRRIALFEISEISLQLLLKEKFNSAYSMKLFGRLYVTVEFILARKFLS